MPVSVWCEYVHIMYTTVIARMLFLKVYFLPLISVYFTLLIVLKQRESDFVCIVSLHVASSLDVSASASAFALASIAIGFNESKNDAG